MSEALIDRNRDRAAMFNGWLVWKESRQLLPLVIALVVVAVMLFLSQLFLQNQRHWQHELIFLVFPGLFATGAGAVMVGQEREQRTMDWLASMPITPQRLILTKFVLAVVGLAAMWVLAAVCMESTHATQQRSSHWRSSSIRSAAEGVQYPMLVAHSMFILISGFYTSWRIKNQFHALIVLVPLACLPIVLSELCVAMINPSGRAMQPQSIWLVMSILLIPVIAFLAYRAAVKTLSPQAAPGLRSRQIAGRLSMPSRTRQAPVFGSQAAPIIWQSIHSARLLLSLLSMLLLLGLVLALFASASAEAIQLFNEPALLLPMLLAPFLSVSWLAVSVFKGDGGVESVRFLADRGISPSLIFFARQGVPLAIIAGALVIYTLLASLVISLGGTQPGLSFLPSLSLLTLVMLVVYSVSQWISQLVRTLTLAVILAPVITALVVGWFVTAVMEMGTPIWILGVCGAMPLVATWLMMRRYIDQRDRPWSWCVGSLLVVLLMAVPIVDAVLRIRPIRMSAATAGLLKEAQTIAGTSQNAVNLMVSPWVSDDGSRPAFTGDFEAFDVENALSWIDKEAQTPEQSILSLTALRQDPSRAAHADYGIYSLIDRLRLERVRFEEASDERKQAALAEHASWLLAGATVVRGLRNSLQWIDQEFADRLEIVIISALTSAELQPYRSTEEFQAAIDLLPSRQQRNASRRTAVLASWVRSIRQPDTRQWQQSIGGITFPVHDYPLLSYYFDLGERNKEAVVAAAVDALRDQSSPGEVSWQRRMHALIAPSDVRFELGPNSSRFRDLPALQVFRMETTYPARYWGMKWETQLENLKAPLPATPSNQNGETSE